MITHRDVLNAPYRLARQQSAAQLGKSIRMWIDGFAQTDPQSVDAKFAGKLHIEVAFVFPDAKRTFGWDMLEAATRPKSDDRWLQAFMSANVGKRELPSDSEANRACLGSTPSALAREYRQLIKPKAPALTASASTSDASILDVVPAWARPWAARAKANFHPAVGSCMTCTEWHRGLIHARKDIYASARVALTAGATVHLPELAPHKPRSAPPVPVTYPPGEHTGRGAHAECKHQDCYAIRRAIYARANGFR
jgi:hypothetical protein